MVETQDCDKAAIGSWGENVRAILLAQPLNPLARCEFSVASRRPEGDSDGDDEEDED